MWGQTDFSAAVARQGGVRNKRNKNYNGDESSQIRFVVGASSLGSLLVAVSEKGICAILIGDEEDALVRDMKERFPQANRARPDAKLADLLARVVRFVEAPASRLGVSFDLRGTAFQQRVWQELQQIPCGTTASYAEIAKCIGAPRAARAVASAIAANPLAVAVPCHRVVHKDGSLGGYRWGVERKRALLERERVDTSQ